MSVAVHISNPTQYSKRPVVLYVMIQYFHDETNIQYTGHNPSAC